jgi:hypothetical protein
MKHILMSVAILVFLSACSGKNAFSLFDLDEEQELSVASLLSSKLKSKDGKVYGIVSAIYLNDIYPEAYHNDEYFFMYVYLKEKEDLHNPKYFDNFELNLKLNGVSPLKIEQLPYKNQFFKLTFIKSDWNQYYIVAFKKQNKDMLNLVLKNAQSSSDSLKYQKNKP